MCVSNNILAVWTVGAVLVAGAGAMAQHDPNANNTQVTNYLPVDGKGGQFISGPYDVVPNWPQPLPGHEGWQMSRVAGVWAESPDRVWVVTSGELPTDYQGPRAWGPTTIPTLVPGQGALTTRIGRYEHIILIFDRNGKLVDDSWDKWRTKLKGINRILVSPYDPDRHIWIVDQGTGSVFKFTREGNLVLEISEKSVPGGDSNRFGAQDMAWLPNGDFYVTGGSRVAKFSAQGEYVTGFGRPGTGPGELNGTHGIQIDARGRIYVADRANSRVQVFDENGEPLDIWPNIVAPYTMRLSKDGQHMWISDGYTQTFQKYDLDGRLVKNSTWGTFGVMPGTIWGPHYFDVDSEGNLYVAEDYGARVQKFRPRTDGSPEQLVDVMR